MAAPSGNRTLPKYTAQHLNILRGEYPLEVIGGEAGAADFLGSTRPRTRHEAKANLAMAYSRLPAKSPVLAWLHTFDDSFDHIAAQAVIDASAAMSNPADAGYLYVNNTLPYEPQLFEALLQGAAGLLDRCLQYRREMGSFEISGVKAAFDYLTFLHTTRIQRNLLELSNPSSPIGVVLGVAPIVDQWVSRKGLHYTGLLGPLGTARVAMRGGGCGGRLSLSCSIRRRSSGSGWV